MLPAPVADGLGVEQAGRFDPDAWIARLSALPLVYEPGERWLYHVASDILGVLIARIMGQPLETFLRERLFAPLAMGDTSFANTPADRRPGSSVLIT